MYIMYVIINYIIHVHNMLNKYMYSTHYVHLFGIKETTH